VGAWLGAGEWLERWRAAAFGTRFRFHLFRRGGLQRTSADDVMFRFEAYLGSIPCGRHSSQGCLAHSNDSIKGSGACAGSAPKALVNAVY
jgi:hypothetical protein